MHVIGSHVDCEQIPFQEPARVANRFFYASPLLCIKLYVDSSHPEGIGLEPIYIRGQMR